MKNFFRKNRRKQQERIGVATPVEPPRGFDLRQFLRESPTAVTTRTPIPVPNTTPAVYTTYGADSIIENVEGNHLFVAAIPINEHEEQEQVRQNHAPSRGRTRRRFPRHHDILIRRGWINEESSRPRNPAVHNRIVGGRRGGPSGGRRGLQEQNEAPEITQQLVAPPERSTIVVSQAWAAPSNQRTATATAPSAQAARSSPRHQTQRATRNRQHLRRGQQMPSNGALAPPVPNIPPAPATHPAQRPDYERQQQHYARPPPIQDGGREYVDNVHVHPPAPNGAMTEVIVSRGFNSGYTSDITLPWELYEEEEEEEEEEGSQNGFSNSVSSQEAVGVDGTCDCQGNPRTMSNDDKKVAAKTMGVRRNRHHEKHEIIQEKEEEEEEEEEEQGPFFTEAGFSRDDFVTDDEFDLVVEAFLQNSSTMKQGEENIRNSQRQHLEQRRQSIQREQTTNDSSTRLILALIHQLEHGGDENTRNSVRVWKEHQDPDGLSDFLFQQYQILNETKPVSPPRAPCSPVSRRYPAAATLKAPPPPPPMMDQCLTPTNSPRRNQWRLEEVDTDDLPALPALFNYTY